jgi:hypothetical protein
VPHEEVEPCVECGGNTVRAIVDQHDLRLEAIFTQEEILAAAKRLTEDKR